MYKILRTLGVIASLALLVGLAPSATADHSTDWPTTTYHEDRPDFPTPVYQDVLAECVVDGIVKTWGDGGAKHDPDKVDPEQGMVPAHTHYSFEDSALTCEPVHNNYGGVFNVVAWGGADGPCQVDPVNGGTNYGCPTETKHGSTTAISWSHSGGTPGDPGTSKGDPGGGYKFWDQCGDTAPPWPPAGAGTSVNKNSITAERISDGKSGEGWVKFVREGTNAFAWGQFCTGGLAGAKFTADLVFTPFVDEGGNTVDNRFNLDGASTVFCGDFLTSNDKGTKAPCPKV